MFYMKRGICLIFALILLSALVFALDEDNDGYCVEKNQCPNHPDELDCNDNNPLINPAASEGYIADGIDNDCNGIIDDITIECVDSDLDGYNLIIQGNEEVCGPEDCDDSRADVNPGQSEICDDSVDNDCDGTTDTDDEDCVSSEESSQGSGSGSSRGSFGGGQQSYTEITKVCNYDNITVSCLGVKWSACDPVTKKQTRDTSQCKVVGTTNPDCIKDVLSNVNNERPCNVEEKTDENEVLPVRSYCGDEFCDDDEDRISCPEDCSNNECGDGVCSVGENEVNCQIDCVKKSNLGWVIFIIIMLIALGSGITVYVLKKKKPSKKVSVNEKDLQSLIEFIKKARARKMSDQKITELLLKHKWKMEQLKLAFDKLKKASKK